MRPIARQSSRLASSSRVRQSSIPRTRRLQQARAFYASANRSSDPRPPNGHSDHYTPFNEHREEQKKSENGLGRSDQTIEQENEESKPSNDGHKPGIRRSLRQKRMNDVPKPPPIPQWFLKHNVKLLRDSPGLDSDEATGQQIHCVDVDTGHVLFTVPYYSEAGHEPVEKTGKHIVKGRQDRHRPQDPARTSNNKPPNVVKNDIDQDFFNHKFQPRKEQPAVKRIAQSNELVLDEDKSQEESTRDPLSDVFLEAELSIRAALSLALEEHHRSSFAVDRVDLSLQCPDLNSHDHLDELVGDLARITRADLIRLDANDFAELTSEYVGQGRDEPGSYSNLGYDVFDGYEVAALSSRPNPYQSQVQDHEENDMDEEEDEDEDDRESSRGSDLGPFTSMGQLKKALLDGRNDLGRALGGRVVGIGIGTPRIVHQTLTSRRPIKSSSTESSDMHRDDARLVALLDSLLDAPKQKRAAGRHDDNAVNRQHRSQTTKDSTLKGAHDDANWHRQKMLRSRRSNASLWLPQTSNSFVDYLGRTVQHNEAAKTPFTLTTGLRSSSHDTEWTGDDRPRTIVHVRDLRDICNSRLGENVIYRLVKAVQKRRRCGEQIIIVGTTAQDAPGPYRTPGDHSDEFPFRSITLPPFLDLSPADLPEFEASSANLPQETLDDPAYGRILEINLRHLQTMIRRLTPNEEVDLLDPHLRSQLSLPGTHFLSERVLPLDQVQRLVLIAVGLKQSHAQADALKPIHLALASFVATRSDHMMQSWSLFKESKQSKKFRSDLEGSESIHGSEKGTTEARMDHLKKTCNTHESRLLSGMVDPHNIKTGFADVHATPDTIDALKTLTTLSLLRPDAFKYGVLANDRLPGLLLYGPPGTGKTLLAKAVAKESKATVLEISGAQIYEKYVGEGEKMVRAVFTLAKKLSPCIVFIDEADAIFGSRSNAGNRNTHREIINQFLREWDGMDDHGVFIMVASNRPFDLDDAVLRRLPRRLLVDLPVAKDRQSILGIHLQHEHLDLSVSLRELAAQTPLYSGSDLKNVSVAAALACVREENARASEHDLPLKRTLTSRHFDQALAEISASISEDMGSLTAIRKFDEQYGDRRGRRKKAGYGFGIGDDAVDESAARVRQAPSSSSSSSSSPPPP